ncbi:MAG: GNAT family N-acetyltransferase [Planctomycetaceae bacterium]|nr:GNAT family N-acetyltransferase [Planctomycetaceae bacterium]
MNLVDVTVYYLEMLAPTGRVVPPPCEGLAVERVAFPAVTYYRKLYDAVGRDYHWLSRRKLSDEQLAEILNDPLSEVLVLKVDGADAGFAELDARQPQDVELVQFGLMPDFMGQGLGRWFLQQTIDHVWSKRPDRFWLHTCTLDHSAALPMYEQAGFLRYKEEQIRREL